MPEWFPQWEIVAWFRREVLRYLSLMFSRIPLGGSLPIIRLWLIPSGILENLRNYTIITSDEIAPWCYKIFWVWFIFNLSYNYPALSMLPMIQLYNTQWLDDMPELYPQWEIVAGLRRQVLKISYSNVFWDPSRRIPSDSTIVINTQWNIIKTEELHNKNFGWDCAVMFIDIMSVIHF